MIILQLRDTMRIDFQCEPLDPGIRAFKPTFQSYNIRRFYLTILARCTLGVYLEQVSHQAGILRLAASEARTSSKKPPLVSGPSRIVVGYCRAQARATDSLPCYIKHKECYFLK